jgi:hypothetical protein
MSINPSVAERRRRDLKLLDPAAEHRGAQRQDAMSKRGLDGLSRPWRRPSAWTAGLTTALGLLAILDGCCCEPKERLTAPTTIVAPYDTSRGEALWAVVPLRNESGTSLVNTESISDKLVNAVEEVQGIRCVPLNRTIQAMDALGLATLQNPADARKLAQAMGVDGVLVGSVTAYDPYTPELGLAVALYARPGAMAQGQQHPLDTRALAARPTDTNPSLWSRNEGPVAVVSEHLDSKNNQVLMDLKSYAQGRMKGPSALGWKRYTASMDLFSEFAVYHAVDGLMKQEWTRLPGGVGVASAEATR